jgi:hypothetical protein
MPDTPQPGSPEYEALKAKVESAEKPSNHQTFSVDDLVRQAKVNVVAAPPPVTAKAKPAAGMFKGQDGREYWRYDLDGEMVILPKPIEKMTEEDFYKLPPSLYNMQAGRLPQNLTVVFKDPQWAGYWFNKSAKNGVRVSVARALGYVPATKEDCETIVAGLDDTTGAIEQHDLVLMKIHKAKLFMKYAEWINQAKLRGGIESYKNAAESEAMSRGGDLSKGQYYLTPQAKNEFQGLGPVVNLPTVATT